MVRKTNTPGSVEGIDITETVASIRQQLAEDDSIPPALRASIELLILVVTLLAAGHAGKGRPGTWEISFSPS